MPLSNASRLADFGTGIGTAGAIIQVDNANQRLGVGTTAPTATLGVAGIVSATAFYGDGSNLDGVASAGLGTALSEEEFNPLTVIYQTSDTLSVGSTITVDPPDATTKVAYTQYAEVKLEGDADLIVADGDDFIPDILGLSTEGFSFSNANGNGIFDTVYTDNIENAAGRGAPNFPLGITVSGISTLSGNVSIGGTLTYEDVTNVDSVGMVTARNGIDITGGDLNAASNLILKTGGNEKVRITSAGLVGIGTDLPGGKVTVAGISASARFELKRTNTNTTGAIGVINWTALDGHSVANMYALGDGDDEGAHLVFKTTSAAASNDPFNAATVERLRIGSAGQIGLSGANYGTSGQVITSQGSGAAPQWASPAGVWVKLASGSATSGATHTITTNLLTSTYFYYKILFHTTNPTGGYACPAIDTTTDGSTWGSSFGSTAYSTAHMGRWGASAREGNGTNQYGVLMHGTNMQTWGGEITFAGPHLTGVHKRFHFIGWFGNILGNNPGTVDSTILRDDEGTGAAITGIRYHHSGDPLNYLKWSLLGSAI